MVKWGFGKVTKTSKKGQGSLIETFLILFMSVGIVVAGFQLPRIIDSFVELMTLASAEATARNLAGMITVSGAAADSAIITYTGPDEDISYDIRIENRYVFVTAVRENGEIILEGEAAPGGEGMGKMAVGNISRVFIDARSFDAEKNRTVTAIEIYDDYDVRQDVE
jgi:hypothetical protein